MPFFSAQDGARIHYVDRGEGGAILFIHGWMMSHRFFHRQLDALAASRRCIALDLRGCGDSETRPGTHTMDQYARDVAALLEHLGLEKVTIVGWSMGGGITMRYLDHHGTARVQGVGLIDFPPRFEEDPTVADRVCQKLETGRDAFLDGFFKRMFLQPPAPAELAMLKAENAKCQTRTGCEMYRQLGAGDSRGRRMETPALLIFPAQGWFPKALAPWKEIFPRHESPPFERSRHCPFLEEHERFNDALLAFTR